MKADLVVRDLDVLLTMDEARGEGPLGPIPNGAVAFRDETVVWLGPSQEAPEASRVVVAKGEVGLPGLVDAHTHAVWAGSRTDEWEARLRGAAYQDALAKGGGIHSTVTATRAAQPETLTELTTARLRHLAEARGTTTVEVKSGYGLDQATEVAMLKAAREAGIRAGVNVMTTFLGAHVVPKEYANRRDAYVTELVQVHLPAIVGLADFVDVFVDEGAFTVDEGRRILTAAKNLGFGLKIHAEQLTYTGAAQMAAELGAVSADHLEQIDEAGIEAMARHGTSAGLLPGAMLSLRLPSPPVAALREAGVSLFVATDLNPGSSTFYDLLTCASLACLTMGLTVEESLLGITSRAATALGRSDVGRLTVGGKADFVALRPAPGEPATPASILQHVGGTRLTSVVRGAAA
ncbi:MAG: imidazolonepropionase [Myxococcota bacterium]